MTRINGKDKVLFGRRKDDGATIYISKPKWNCGWYWGFGYLGNRNEHYHLDGYQSKQFFAKLEDGKYAHHTEKRNICMYDALLEDYDLAENIKDNLWEFCELVLSAYRLKAYAELLHIGGAHMTTNPCADLIKNEDEEKRINEIVLPAIFNKINDIYEGKVEKK